MLPSPSLGPPLLSASWSPPPPCGMPAVPPELSGGAVFSGAGAVFSGAGAVSLGAGALFSGAAGAGAGVFAAGAGALGTGLVFAGAGVFFFAGAGVVFAGALVVAGGALAAFVDVEDVPDLLDPPQPAATTAAMTRTNASAAPGRRRNLGGVVRWGRLRGVMSVLSGMRMLCASVPLKTSRRSETFRPRRAWHPPRR
jgi:hypothetical protein